MEPTLLEGEFVLVKHNVDPHEGSIVVARHPDDSSLLVVKRVGAIAEDGAMELSSDNPEFGTDSRTWGPVPAQAMVGLVTIVLDRPTVALG